MNRSTILLLAVVTLALGNVGYRVWKNWGLITIHATEEPLSSVIRTVEKKGGITIRTNMDTDRKITMHVVKAPLAYVLEVLANVSDSRWSMSYFLAPSKGEISQALGSVAAGEPAQGWKRWQLEVPRGMVGLPEDEAPADPRTDRWEVKPASEATLQAYLEQASKNVSARFSAPESWNPTVSSPPKPGKLDSVMPKLAKAAGGQLEEVVLLLGRPRNAETATADTAGGRDGGARLGPSPFGPGGAPAEAATLSEEEIEKRRLAMEERVQAELAKLPDDKRAAAQAEWDERRKFMEEMSKLTPEQRREKMEARMSDPAAANRMEAGMAKRDAMKTPDQRAERSRAYLERKAKAAN